MVQVSVRNDNEIEDGLGGQVRVSRPAPDSRRLEAVDTPDMRAILAHMDLEGHLIIANNRGQSMEDRQYTDRQWARIVRGFDRIALGMVSGREPAVVAVDIGYPPCTFSEVMEVPPGGMLTLVHTWRSSGIPTLLPFLTVKPPARGLERRRAVMYGWGPQDLLGKVEAQFLRHYDPLCYTQCFGAETGDGKAHVWFQFQLFRPELAEGLGLPTGSPEVGRIFATLVAQAQALRTRNVQPHVEEDTDEGWFEREAA